MRILKSRFAICANWLVPEVRYLGFKKDYYDGTFWNFGLWYWHFYITDNPHFVLSKREIEENIRAYEKRS